MKSTTINMLTLFVPLMVGIILTLFAGGANAECCYVGGCSPTAPSCVPCQTADVCGPSGSCAASYCNHHAMEGILSPESFARKLNQEAVEMRKAEQALEDRKLEQDAIDVIGKRVLVEEANEEKLEA